MSSARRAQSLSASVANRATHSPRVEPALEKPLPELALAGHPQEEPRKRDEGDDRAFDHHHRAGKTLICERREPRQPLTVLVDGIERRPGPEEDVPEHRLDRAHDGDVTKLRTGPEPFWRRQGLEDGEPHDHAAREEAQVLERVHRAVTYGRVVEVRQAPRRTVQRPQRQPAERMGGEAQPMPARTRRPLERPPE